MPGRCRILAPRRAEQELPKIHGPTSDISSHEIGIHLLESCGRKDPTCHDAVLESGCEALNLALKSAEHVERGAVRDVAVSPGGMPAFGRASVIE